VSINLIIIKQTSTIEHSATEYRTTQRQNKCSREKEKKIKLQEETGGLMCVVQSSL